MKPTYLQRMIDEAKGHLGAALVQASPRDDQIITGHIRNALASLKALDVDPRGCCFTCKPD